MKVDNFKFVYKILSRLEEDMDAPQVSIEKIDHEAFCISETRWLRYIEMMCDCGYIKGVDMVRDVRGGINYDCSNMRITLKGLEYLQENGVMQKMGTRLNGERGR